jgi:hypothetical protein
MAEATARPSVGSTPAQPPRFAAIAAIAALVRRRAVVF